MDIKEMRELLHESRAAFSRRYNIPVRTLENWEAEKNKCPDYVRELLERAVREDSKEMKKGEKMKFIKITNEEIVTGFCKQCAVYISKEIENLHKRIINMPMSVDCNGDILAQDKDGSRYWITTEPTISIWNRDGMYEIKIRYSVHKESKYNDEIFGFIR